MSRIQQRATGWNWMKWKLMRENAPSECSGNGVICPHGFIFEKACSHCDRSDDGLNPKP